jgi:V8-like Glu-specific endopeptidase
MRLNILFKSGGTMKRQLLVRATRLALPLALAIAPVVQSQDLDAARRQRMFYDVKPGVVLVWASVKADIVLAGPSAASSVGLTMLEEPVFMAMHAEMSSFGTGWLITPDGYLATNGHVIQIYHDQNEDKLQMQLFHDALDALGFFENQAVQRYFAQGGPGATEIPQLTMDKRIQLLTRLLPFAKITLDKELDVYLQNWQAFPAEVKEYSPPIMPFTGRASVPGKTWATGKDVAILKIEGRDLPTMRIGDSDRMQLGDNVHVAGYPGTASFNNFLKPRSPMEASFTRGQISSLKVDVKGSRLLQTDAAITFGNSGGPMLNEREEVIGMATMVDPEAQGFNYGVPTSVITEFVRAAGVTPAQGMFDRAWKEALDQYYRADSVSDAGEKLRLYNASVGGFDQALRVLPNLTDALNLRREALARADELRGRPQGGGSRTTWIVAGAALVALVLIGLALMMRRRGVGAMVPARSGNSAPKYRLVVRAGPLQGNTFTLAPSGVRIGRDPATCQVVLTEETVSREHALIVANGNNSEVVVKNLSGTNRTFVNDRPIQETVLHAGDTIKIGNSVISLEQV